MLSNYKNNRIFVCEFVSISFGSINWLWNTIFCDHWQETPTNPVFIVFIEAFVMCWLNKQHQWIASTPTRIQTNDKEIIGVWSTKRTQQLQAQSKWTKRTEPNWWCFNMVRVIIASFILSPVIVLCLADIQPKVLNGYPTHPYQFPYYAFIISGINQTAICGGTLISDRYVDLSI